MCDLLYRMLTFEGVSSATFCKSDAGAFTSSILNRVRVIELTFFLSLGTCDQRCELFIVSFDILATISI